MRRRVQEQRGVQIIFEDRPLLRIATADKVVDYELRDGQLMNLAEQALKAERQRRQKSKLD